MPSFVWNREPSEAFKEPYEYGGQEQFLRESQAVIAKLKVHYSRFNHHFSREDKSIPKAVWMLQVDALDALFDGLELINENRHRLVSRLFRDVIETLDTSLYFSQAGDEAKSKVLDWYQNEVIPHRVARNFIKQHQGDENFELLRATYNNFSKYTHRTYEALLLSYMLGKNDNLSYDGFSSISNYALPHVISFSYAVLAMLIKRFIEYSLITGQLTKAETDKIWSTCLEPESIPRRFGFGPGQIIRGDPVRIDLDE